MLTALANRLYQQGLHYQTQRFERLDLRQAQAAVFQRLLKLAQGSRFAKAHGLEPGLNLQQLQQRVPLTDYPYYWQGYLEPHLHNLQGVLSAQPVPLLARTSGTTSGQEKYLPVTPAFLADMRQASAVQGSFNALRIGELQALFSPFFWLTDLSSLFQVGPYPTATISRLMRHALPPWLDWKMFPGRELVEHPVAGERFQRIAQAALSQDIWFISGITPWLLSMCERILELAQVEQLQQLWPHLRLVAHAGVDFAPYQARFERLCGPGVQYAESYTTTEGYIGFQAQSSEGLRLLPAQGLLYEFVRARDLEAANPRRYWLWEVEPGVPYALYLSNAMGLWSYQVGDFVQFERCLPYPTFWVLGRIQESIDFLGEKMLLQELKGALQQGCQQLGLNLQHFHVGPDFAQLRLELLLEFAQPPGPELFTQFLQQVDTELQRLNDQFRRNRHSGINMAPAGRVLQPGAFQAWLQATHGTNLQSKIPFVYRDPAAFETLKGWLQQAGQFWINT